MSIGNRVAITKYSATFEIYFLLQYYGNDNSLAVRFELFWPSERAWTGFETLHHRFHIYPAYIRINYFINVLHENLGKACKNPRNIFDVF